jgi:hypothetical protein
MEQTPIQVARHRLEVLYADIVECHGLNLDTPKITPAEARAIRIVLDELHRLNMVVTVQAARLRPKKTVRK